MERVAETAELEIGHATKDFIAGAISGMVGICAGQPLDTLRVRLQQRGSQQTSTAAILRASGAKAGVRDLFRGMTYPLYTIALQNAVCFQAQGAAARALTGSDSRSVVSWQHTCISGMFAGAMTSFISAPTELLKIRMQLQKPLPGTPGYLGPWHMLRQLVHSEGVLGLTRGLGMTLLRDTPSYGVYFCVYHFAVQGLGQVLYPVQQQQQQPQQEQQTQQQHLGVVQAAAQTPGQQQQQQQQQQGQGGLAHTVVQKEQQLLMQAGSVWEGAEHPTHQQQLSLVQHVPQLVQQQQQQQGSQQPPMEQQQQQLGQQQQQQQQGQKQANPGASQPVVQFIAGGLAGALAWMSIYPIDVIKCRMQAASWLSAPYTGAWDCAVTSWRQEGSRVFVRGLGATMGRGFVVNAAIFAAFEACMDAMNA